MLATVLTVLLIVTALGGIVWGYLYWLARFTPNVRKATVHIRGVLAEVVAHVGAEPSLFHEPDHTKARQDLVDLEGRVHSRKLRSAIGALLAAYQRTIEQGPHPATPRMAVDGVPPTAEQQAERAERKMRSAHQVECAGLAREKVDAVLAQVNRLERPLPWSRDAGE